MYSLSMNTKQVLSKLGLNSKEILGHLELLKHGQLNPAELAKLTKLSRATLYHIAKTLVSKGIVGEDLRSKVLYFVALPPEKLISILGALKRELSEKESLVHEAIGGL